MALNIWTGEVSGDMSVVGNWSLGALPLDHSEVLVPKWASNGWTAALGTLSSIHLNSLVFERGFSKDVGDDETYAQVSITGSGSQRFIFAGEGAKAKLDLGATTVDAIIRATGSRNPGDPALQLRGTAMTEVVVLSGDVAIGFDEDDATTNVDTVHVGGGEGVDPYVQLGRGVTANGGGAPSVNVQEGEFLSKCNIATLQQQDGISVQSEGGWATLNLYGGIHHPDSDSANYGTANVFSGGEVQNTRDLRSKTMAAAVLHNGSSWRDKHGGIILTAGPTFPGSIEEVDLQLRPNIRMPITYL